MNPLAARIKQCAKLKGEFTLRSGKVSDTYFDKYQFEAEPSLLLAIAREMAALIPPGTQVLAGLEMGGIPVVTMLSQVTGLPAAFIRKAPKDYGTCRYAEGASLVDKQFVLVEDVVSSGGALLDALSLLEADGLRPSGALCVRRAARKRWPAQAFRSPRSSPSRRSTTPDKMSAGRGTRAT